MIESYNIQKHNIALHETYTLLRPESDRTGTSLNWLSLTNLRREVLQRPTPHISQSEIRVPHH